MPSVPARLLGTLIGSGEDPVHRLLNGVCKYVASRPLAALEPPRRRPRREQHDDEIHVIGSPISCGHCCASASPTDESVAIPWCSAKAGRCPPAGPVPTALYLTESIADRTACSGSPTRPPACPRPAPSAARSRARQSSPDAPIEPGRRGGGPQNDRSVAPPQIGTSLPTRNPAWPMAIPEWAPPGRSRRPSTGARRLPRWRLGPLRNHSEVLSPPLPSRRSPLTGHRQHVTGMTSGSPRTDRRHGRVIRWTVTRPGSGDEVRDGRRSRDAQARQLGTRCTARGAGAAASDGITSSCPCSRAETAE
jgi:hypothetical protein